MKKQSEIVGSLITVGDELLQGDVPNANAHHIAHHLRARGFRLCSMVTVGDREEEIIEVLNRHLDKSHFLIVTGGLGPTEDDRTGAAAAKAFKLPLVSDHTFKEWLKKRVDSRGLTWSDEIDKLTILPQGSVKMRMEMAGFFLEYRNIPCYFLPGVPEEMKTLLDQVVIPDLEKRFPQRPFYTKHILRVQELVEAEIGRQLKELSCDDLGVEIGYLPQVGENWVTIFVVADNEAEAHERLKTAETQIISRLGAEYISGQNDECLEKVIGCQLRSRGWRMAAAESCTGGLLSQKITSVPGASDYFDRAFVTYSNEAKTELLSVPEELLKTHGAVSAPVASAMARGARTQAKVDVAVAITGIAGPTGGSEEKPVGTVFIACSTPQGEVVEQYLFNGTREQIQERAALAALALLWRILRNDSDLHCRRFAGQCSERPGSI